MKQKNGYGNLKKIFFLLSIFFLITSCSSKEKNISITSSENSYSSVITEPITTSSIDSFTKSDETISISSSYFITSYEESSSNKEISRSGELPWI